MDDTEDTRIYKVVVNHEEQYSIGLTIESRRWVERGRKKSGPKANVWPTLRCGPTCGRSACVRKWKETEKNKKKRITQGRCDISGLVRSGAQ